MLTWYREDYIITVTDAAQTSLGHFFTPDGPIHDPAVSRVVPKRELWDVYQIQAWPINVTTGNNKRGGYMQLCLLTDRPGIYVSLPTIPEDGIMGFDGGLRYKGPPLISTHGVGWFYNDPAMAQGDHMFLLVQYAPRGRPL